MQFDNNSPIYLQIIKEMTLRILSGVIKPGDKLASVRELATQFGVNPNTMQRAMTEMEREGLVYTERTNGRFLTEQIELLSQKKALFAREETEKYLAYMQKIGFSHEEIISYLQGLQQEGENSHEFIGNQTVGTSLWE